MYTKSFKGVLSMVVWGAPVTSTHWMGRATAPPTCDPLVLTLQTPRASFSNLGSDRGATCRRRDQPPFSKSERPLDLEDLARSPKSTTPS